MFNTHTTHTQITKSEIIDAIDMLFSMLSGFNYFQMQIHSTSCRFCAQATAERKRNKKKLNGIIFIEIGSTILMKSSNTWMLNLIK